MPKPRNTTNPKQDPAIQHIPGQEAFPAMDDMTPQPIHSGPPTQDPAPQEPHTTGVTIIVPGNPTSANVLNAVLVIVTQAMLADGWEPQAITAAIHAQVAKIVGDSRG